MEKNYLFEIWRDIKGFEGLYQVSNLGRVRSIDRNLTLKPNVNKKNGYCEVSLFNKGKRKTYTVHRLVAITFIPNPNNYPEVNHKDENKTNNCVWNLEWCTHKYNCQYGTRNQRVSKKMTKGKSSKSVLQYDLEGNLIREWFSASEIQRQLGYNRSAISNCCRCIQYRNTAYGYIWRYSNT